MEKKDVTVYRDCTVCNLKLTESDINLNVSADNPYYPICETCLKKFADRIVNIVK